MTSSPFTPDDSDLLEFADAVNAGKNPQPATDLERTYLHVHNAMQGDNAALSSSTKQSTWENVMNTLSLAPERPVSNRTKRLNGQSVPTRPFRPRRLQWTPAASVAAAALIIIASLGTWWAFQPTNDAPPLAPQHAGIAPGGDVAQIAATPNATAVSSETELRSVPIIQQVDEQPMDGPVIWLTTTGEVMYDDGLGAIQTIASDAFQVRHQTTNVIQVLTHAPEKDSTGRNGEAIQGYTITYYNLVNGKSLVDDGSFSSYLGGPNTFGTLTILTIADAPREWSVVNFETMESISLSELTGGQYRSSDSITVAVSDDRSTIAVATSTYETEGSAILNRQSGLPGDVAVIPADLSGVTWVVVPEGITGVNNISLSPDGHKIALIASDQFRGGSNMTIAVVDIASGEVLTRTQRTESSTFSHFQWVENGSAFVIVGDSTVQKYALDGTDPMVIFETEGTISQMPQIGIDNLLHLSVTSNDTTLATPPAVASQFVILNTSTGEAVTVEGKPWYLGASYPVQMTRTLAPVPVSKDGRTAVLVHPVTGAVYPNLVADVYDPVFDPEYTPVAGESFPFVMPVANAYDANVSVVTLTDGTLALFHTDENSMEAAVIDRPADDPDGQLQLSADGRYLTSGAPMEVQAEGDTYRVIDLANPDAGWVQGETGHRIDFVDLTNP